MAKPKLGKFSPSSSFRWMNCPGSMWITEPGTTSKFAQEGTAAHEVAANCLKNGQDAAEWVGEEIEVDEKKFKVTEEMAENVQVYLDAIRNDLTENGIPVSELDVEKKFEIALGSTISGTNDASFSSPLGKLYVYDYKHGAGTYVEVVNNSQLMIYAAGALAKAGWVNDVVEIVIVQPRFKAEDVAPVRRWEVLREDLIDFVADVTLAIKAAQVPGCARVAGEWCGKTFCPAFGTCPAVRGNVVAVVDAKSTALTFPDPNTLTPEQIAKVLAASGLISDWAKAVRDYAERQAIEVGVQIPGYKLVQKFGRRAWIDEAVVENEFEHEFGDRIYDKKLKSPAQMEKIAGKDRVKVLVSVPDKGLELVPEHAKGEAVLTSPGQVFQAIPEGAE